MTEDLRDDPLLSEVPESDGRKLLDSCVLSHLIGRGGMGAVYLARHRTLEIDVAVKCLLPAIAASNSDMVARFEREAKLAARLNHPNIVRVFDVNHRHGLHYIVMEYVEGETARGRVMRKGGPLAIGEAVTIVYEAAKGLAAIHAQGIVHRDIKPDNILISKRGEAKLADLGLGCLREEAGVGSNLTLSGVAIGTPRYMPPEQWDGLVRVGPPGDVWALGATLYFLLAGEEAWPGNTPTEIMRRICTEPFPDIRKKLLPPPRGLLDVLARCTESDPKKRYPTASQLVTELEKVIAKHGLKGSLEGQPPEGTRPSYGVVSPPPRLPTARSLEATASLVVTESSTQERTARQRTASRRTIEACIVGAVFAVAVIFVASILPLRNEGLLDPVAEAAAPAASRLAIPVVPPDRGPPTPVPEESAEPTPDPKPLAREEPPAAVEPPAPELRFEAPADGAWIRSPFDIEGRVTCADKCVVRVDDQEAAVSDGRWKLRLQLPDGDPTITVRARNSRGRETTVARAIHIDTTAPAIEVIEPARGAAVLTREARLPVRVKAVDRGPIREVRIRGTLALREDDGAFTAAVPLVEGPEQVTIEAIDQAGNTATVRFESRRDSTPPTVSLLEPRERVAAGRVSVRGRVNDASTCSVRVNGERATVAPDGAWQAEVSFELGQRTIRVEANDSLGNEAAPVVEAIEVGPRKVVARDIAGFTRLGKNEQGCHEYRHDRTGIVMVLVPAGTFSMGSTPEAQAQAGSEIDARENNPRAAVLLKRSVTAEGQQHDVTFASFLIAKDELSQRAWRAVMGTDPSAKKGDDLPVENVSWNDAEELCRRTGLFLPTEAQWECACSAGGFSPTGLGIRDMLGGIAEWCEDAYVEGFYATEEASAPNPVAASVSKTALRVVRGGSWATPAWARRPTSRNGALPHRVSPLRGFRPAFYPLP